MASLLVLFFLQQWTLEVNWSQSLVFQNRDLLVTRSPYFRGLRQPFSFGYGTLSSSPFSNTEFLKNEYPTKGFDVSWKTPLGAFQGITSVRNRWPAGKKAFVDRGHRGLSFVPRQPFKGFQAQLAFHADAEQQSRRKTRGWGLGWSFKPVESFGIAGEVAHAGAPAYQLRVTSRVANTNLSGHVRSIGQRFLNLADPKVPAGQPLLSLSGDRTWKGFQTAFSWTQLGSGPAQTNTRNWTAQYRLAKGPGFSWASIRLWRPFQHQNQINLGLSHTLRGTPLGFLYTRTSHFAHPVPGPTIRDFQWTWALRYRSLATQNTFLLQRVTTPGRPDTLTRTLTIQMSQFPGTSHRIVQVLRLAPRSLIQVLRGSGAATQLMCGFNVAPSLPRSLQHLRITADVQWQWLINHSNPQASQHHRQIVFSWAFARPFAAR